MVLGNNQSNENYHRRENKFFTNETEECLSNSSPTGQNVNIPPRFSRLRRYNFHMFSNRHYCRPKAAV